MPVTSSLVVVTTLFLFDTLGLGSSNDDDSSASRKKATHTTKVMHLTGTQLIQPFPNILLHVMCRPDLYEIYFPSVAQNFNMKLSTASADIFRYARAIWHIQTHSPLIHPLPNSDQNPIHHYLPPHHDTTIHCPYPLEFTHVSIVKQVFYRDAEESVFYDNY
ncbi:hypothetical protein BDP27DRAFT_1425319 [Rhodocollybia butyracea]|uniref:Uncharacterized protein n=1 Tax=Rhodocollybia butyracea TaxID=206335 RepID=A0A9P5U3V1_9AGAR|nr:hypothetical protein BDP27DRAFT_1425319 [Rhodocollybia butyracea]